MPTAAAPTAFTPPGLLQPGDVFPNPISHTSYLYESTADSITASATQSQAGGTILAAQMVRIVTVASANNAVTLMPSVSGLSVTITNAHATNAITVYPSAGSTTTETINALSANAAYTLAATKTVTFNCYTAGQWHTILTA